MSNKYLDIALEKITKQEINAVLEQIRAEIEAIDVTMGMTDYPFIPREKVLQIIDKYTK